MILDRAHEILDFWSRTDAFEESVKKNKSKKPFIAINHLQGHILVTRMKRKVKFPFLCLLVLAWYWWL